MAEGRNAAGSPGWDALNSVLAQLYPGQTPRHFGTALPYTLGGQDPLDGISVYWNPLPRPHWHYVSYGFSELYDKQSEDEEFSGFGFELSLRLAAGPQDDSDSAPPTWPMSLLQNLARYVYSTGNVFEEGHHLDANGPIAPGSGTRLRHLAFVADPGLPALVTVNGHLQFLQVVGLTDEEMGAVRRWSSIGVLQVLEPAMPGWITVLERGSLLQDPALAAQVEAGSLREGSSTGMVFAEGLDWSQDNVCTTLILGANQVASLCELLPLRLRHRQPLTLVGGERQWRFEPGAGDALEINEDSARCVLGESSLQALLDSLRAERGRYPLPGSALVVEVRPSFLRDAQGNVVREIG